MKISANIHLDTHTVGKRILFSKISRLLQGSFACVLLRYRGLRRHIGKILPKTICSVEKKIKVVHTAFSNFFRVTLNISEKLPSPCGRGWGGGNNDETTASLARPSR